MRTFAPMRKAEDLLKKYLELIEVERLEERRLYRERFLETPLEVRKKKGVTWYPIDVSDPRVGLGDRLLVEVSRPPREIEGNNLFQVGAVVSMWSNADSGKKNKPSVTGVITKSKENTLEIALDSEELPEWVGEGKMGLDLYYDERTYNLMVEATKETMNARNSRLADLRDVLLDELEPRLDPPVEALQLPSLNPSQNEALQLVDSAEDLAIVHGPPGTGKTHTLVRTIAHTLKKEPQVLVCAASNLAVDLLVEKLVLEGVNIVRLGHPARISEIVLRNSLDVTVALHPQHKDIKNLRREADNTRRQALKFKRTFNRTQRQERKTLLWEARELQREARRIEKFILRDVLDKADAIACTLTGAAGAMLEGRHFSTVFIDEAAQAMLPATLIPIQKAERVVFAGDHCQLPPTVKSREAAKAGLDVSLFEMAMDKHPQAAVMLRTQYRMHQQIMEFSNRQFYNGGLEAHSSVAEWKLAGSENKELAGKSVQFIDTAGCSYDERQNPETLSLSNPGEGDLVLRHLGRMLKELPKPDKDNLEASPSIGVISPYKDQVYYLRRQAKEAKPLWPWLKRISIDTVDGFQGQERDIIYISLVRSNTNNIIGFLGDTRRMNVALTRARKLLVVVGDSSTLGNHKFYQGFLDYMDEVGAYASAWEFMED